MKRINVLFGFKTEKTAEAIIRSLSVMGYSVSSTVKETKQDMADYIGTHPELDAVILKEYLDGGGELGTEELIDLSDDSKVNIVIVLDARKRGQDCMKDLYAAGILNAYFSDGKVGANADNLAKLAINGRTHKEAREYYRIDRQRNDHRFMSYYEFKDLYRYLIKSNRGVNIADRFVALTRWIDKEQLAFFIKTLPKATIDELKEYKEFVEINNSLYKARLVDYKYRYTSNAGITPENVAHKMVEEHLSRDKDTTPVIVGVNSAPEEEETVKEEAGVRSDNDIYAYAAKQGISRKKEPAQDKYVDEDIEETVEDTGSEQETAEASADDNAGPAPESVSEGAPETASEEEQTEKKGLFSSLKKKLFDPDRGVVTIDERPVTLEDISSAENNDEFSMEEAVDGVIDTMMDEDTYEPDEENYGETDEDLPGDAHDEDEYEEEVPVEETEEYNRVVRDNNELKERLEALEKMMSEKADKEAEEERKRAEDRKKILDDNEALKRKIREMELAANSVRLDKERMERKLNEMEKAGKESSVEKKAGTPIPSVKAQDKARHIPSVKKEKSAEQGNQKSKQRDGAVSEQRTATEQKGKEQGKVKAKKEVKTPFGKPAFEQLEIDKLIDKWAT